jgi:pimeloyl-[acyl-carrier protein] methyl ester esterase
MLKRFAALQSRGDSRAASVMRQLGRCLAVPPHTTVQALAAGLAILRATDLREEAAGVTQPALIVHGANDAVAHPTAGAWLATALPRGRLTKYDAAGHAPFLSEPRRFVRDLAEFCRD